MTTKKITVSPEDIELFERLLRKLRDEAANYVLCFYSTDNADNRAMWKSLRTDNLDKARALHSLLEKLGVRGLGELSYYDEPMIDQAGWDAKFGSLSKNR